MLEAFRDNQGEAFTLSVQSPPVTDPKSDQRLRRIDVVLKSYMAPSRKRFPVLFHEAKRAEGGAPDYREVEMQAQGACEEYLNSREAVSTVVFAMCCVGTRCRMFRYIKEHGFDWSPMWGNKKEFDATQYFDAMDPFGSPYIWRALISMPELLGIPLERKAYL